MQELVISGDIACECGNIHKGKPQSTSDNQSAK